MCGEVRFRITAPPMLTMACHCTGCQKMTASAFSYSVTIPEAGFEIVAGTPVAGGLHREIPMLHCPSCLNWMFTPVAAFGFVNVRATMLDDNRWVVPFVETWTSEKIPWIALPVAHSHPTMPGAEDFPQYVADFADRGARPA